MAIIINGSTGITNTDGTVSAPSVSGTDSNTGMFFPAADTIAFAEGGVESLRLNSDGQLVTSAGSASLPAITTSGDPNTGIFFPAADTMAFAEGGVEAMRINSSGQVGVNASLGIGTLTPTQRLDVFRNAADYSTMAIRNTVSSLNIAISGAGDAQIIQTGDFPLQFVTNNIERLRMTGGGEVWIAGFTDRGNFKLQCNDTGVWGAGAYTNGSDSRIKEDISPITSGLDVIQKMNPVQFRYKADWSKDRSMQPGFIAQELQQALAGQEYLEGVVHIGPEYLSVAYQTIIPLLVKAVQEQQTQIDELKARIEALEGK
jgi:hypothetical protein